MKKSVLAVFAIVFMAQNLFAQTIGESTWHKKYGFEEGLTQAFVLEANNVYEGNNSQVLLAVNSNNGTINTYQIDKQTGAIGALKFEKTLEKKGVWGVGIVNNRYLAISYANYGSFEIYMINKDGSIGDKTYETNNYEKGISIVVPMPNSILLIKPNAGFAWLVDHKDGKLGTITWQTQGWDKGMTAGICCHASSAYAALTAPNGNFWIVSCKDKKNVSVKYSTKKYENGISTMASNPNMVNSIIIASPNTGHEWALKTGLNSVKIVTDSPNWEKGLAVQALGVFQSKFGYNIPKEAYLYTFKPEIGAVWVFKVKINE